MHKRDQSGQVNVLLLPLIIAVILLIGTAIFGFWAFGQYGDYKNNADTKITAAVAAAKKQEATVQAAQYAEQEKSPLKTYTGPAEIGTVTVQYPKTWSAYVDTSSSSDGSAGLDGYFNPNVVPSISDQNSTFALRVTVVDQSYSSVVQSLSQQQGVTVVPYALPKVPQAVGVRVTGQIDQTHQGDMVIVPLRTETLEVFTQSTDYESDFNTYILPNLTFEP